MLTISVIFGVFINYSLQKILIEYIMLDGVNDEEQHAHLLGKLLETFEVVNTLTLLGSIYELHFKRQNLFIHLSFYLC